MSPEQFAAFEAQRKRIQKNLAVAERNIGIATKLIMIATILNLVRLVYYILK